MEALLLLFTLGRLACKILLFFLIVSVVCASYVHVMSRATEKHDEGLLCAFLHHTSVTFVQREHVKDGVLTPFVVFCLLSAAVSPSSSCKRVKKKANGGHFCGRLNSSTSLRVSPSSSFFSFSLAVLGSSSLLSGGSAALSAES